MLRTNSHILNSEFLNIAVRIISTSENKELISIVVSTIVDLMTGGCRASSSIEKVLRHTELINLLMGKMHTEGFDDVPYIFPRAADMVTGASCNQKPH